MMEVEVPKSTWIKKGATLSDKSARKEFGLTQEEIIEGIRGGKLHYQENNVFGNPFLRLIRSEVEAFVDEKHGSNYLKMKKIKKELAQTIKELKMLKIQVATLELKRYSLQASLDELEKKD
ncbi:MAG: hypothetical protein WA130_05740 [Candidatus Methanoperedens sp.]